MPPRPPPQSFQDAWLILERTGKSPARRVVFRWNPCVCDDRCAKTREGRMSFPKTRSPECQTPSSLWPPSRDPGIHCATPCRFKKSGKRNVMVQRQELRRIKSKISPEVSLIVPAPPCQRRFLHKSPTSSLSSSGRSYTSFFCTATVPDLETDRRAPAPRQRPSCKRVGLQDRRVGGRDASLTLRLKVKV